MRFFDELFHEDHTNPIQAVVVLDPNPPSMFLNEALGNEEFAKRVTFIQGSPLLAKVGGTVLLGCDTLCFLVCITGGMLGCGWWVVGGAWWVVRGGWCVVGGGWWQRFLGLYYLSGIALPWARWLLAAGCWLLAEPTMCCKRNKSFGESFFFQSVSERLTLPALDCVCRTWTERGPPW